MRRYKEPNSESLTLRGTRDAMHEDLMRLVRFNRYDIRFMANIHNKYIKEGKPLSTNQNEVYEKIIFKYRKQLRRLGAPYKRIIETPWENGILSPTELKEKTFLRFVTREGKLHIELFFPYREELKKEVQAISHDDSCEYLNIDAVSKWRSRGNEYDFRWYPEDKVYRGPFNVYLFRKIYDWCVKHEIVIDEYVQDVVNKLNSTGDRKAWTPSVHISNGRMYVCGVAESMLSVLDEIDMTDTSVANIERVCTLGLAPPKEVNNIRMYLAANTYQGVDVGPGDIERLFTYLEKTGRKAIWIKPSVLANKKDESLVYKEMFHRSVGILENLNWNTPMVDIENFRNTTSSFSDQVEEAVDKAREKGYNTIVVNVPIEDVIRSQSYLGKIALEAEKLIYLKQ